MFWKTAKKNSFSSLPLAAQLAVFYVSSVLGIFAALCFLLYPTFTMLLSQVDGSQVNYLKTLCYKKFITTLLLIISGTAMLGIIIAKNSVKKIYEFSSKMKKISAESLDERLNPKDWPKELKALGIEFNLMLDRIQNAFEQLSQFSADIAHELRNPLNNLLGVTELALAKNNIPDEYRGILEANMEEFRHLAKLVSHLLFLARSDQRQIILNKAPIQARQEILSIVAYFQPLADENQIEVTCQGEASLVVDVILFKRVISNILSNALQYTPPHGKIKIFVIKQADQVEILINDSGCGIAQEYLSKVFDRFYRADASRSSQSGNLGLGLAIAKSIMDLHQGTIKIESHVGKGTQVSLFFPHDEFVQKRFM